MILSLINEDLKAETVIFKKNIFLKFLLVFFLLIINADTISYLLLRNDDYIVIYQKVLFAVVFLLSLLFFITWSKTDRICFLIFAFFAMMLVIESLVKYNSLLIYPSVFAVISPFLYVYFIKNLIKKLKIDILQFLIFFIFIGYLAFMIFFGRDFDLSNTPIAYEESGPYSGDTRILHANSILLIVLPFLYFLNKIFSVRRSFFSYLGFAVSLIIIVIHQHRTVWLTAIFAGLLLLRMKGKDGNILRKMFFFLLFSVGIFILLVFFVPGLSNLLIERFKDILDPLNEDNTGGFRYLQILAYLNYFIQKPFFGWTFSGFELSNPFLTDNWEEGSGHHFHNAYVEILFYFGISGLLLKFYPLYFAAKQIKKRLSDKSKILIAFSVSGFLYSFSYVPPLIFWGIVGLCFFYVEKDLIKNHSDQLNFNNGQA